MRWIQLVGGMLLYMAGYVAAEVDDVLLSILAVLVISFPAWILLDVSHDREL